MDADGSHQRQLFDDPGYGDDYPRYLPDGSGFVFFRCANAVEACGVATVRSDGTHIRMLTPQREGVLDLWAAVSPTGRIAFARFFDHGLTVQLYVIDQAGRARPVTPDGLGANVPNWSPDGRRLVFGSCCTVHQNVDTIAADGTGLRQVTHTHYPFTSFQAAYGPAGNRFVFVSNRTHPDGVLPGPERDERRRDAPAQDLWAGPGELSAVATEVGTLTRFRRAAVRLWFTP